MNTSPVTLAELAHATEDLPLETPAAPTSCGASLATRSLAEVFAAEAEGRDPLAPSPEDIATLTTQYRKAVNGLYEAYLFGQMLLTVKTRLEGQMQGLTPPLHPAEAQGASPHGAADAANGETLKNQAFLGDAARGTAEISHGDKAIVGGWNAGTGLKAWLAQHCPEINYSTARRFLAVAEKTNAALAESEAVPASPRPALSAGEGLGRGAPETFPEETIRAYLEGKSQRQLLKAPKAEPTVRHAMSEEERAEKLAKVCKGFLQSLEGVERTGESDLLRLDDRREIVTRLKALARRLEQAVEG